MSQELLEMADDLLKKNHLLEITISKLESRVRDLEKEKIAILENDNFPSDINSIEIYMFNLMRYISSQEFYEMKSEKQAAVFAEFEFIKQAFNVMKNFYKKKEGIIAYRDSDELQKIEDKIMQLSVIDKIPYRIEFNKLMSIVPHMREDACFVYCFSCIEVASSVIGCSISDILECLSGSIKTINGYRFDFESDWIKSQPIQHETIFKTIHKY